MVEGKLSPMRSKLCLAACMAGFGAAFFAIAPGSAQNVAPRPMATPAPAPPSRCAWLGPNAFAVANSQTCIRISGFVAAVAGFGPRPRHLVDASDPFADLPATGLGARLGASVDVVTDTEYGPLLLHADVGERHPAPFPAP
jgi:hypothetical protein